MANKILGAGRKRPQLNIPLNQLLVDNENPRLAEQYMGKDEEEILSVLYEQFDLEEIAFSMVSNGYFDEEPIVVVPIDLPAEFDETQYQDVNDLQNYLEQLTQESNLKFRVLEGNRRTATAKLLTDAKLRAKIGVTEDFPDIDNPIVTEDLKQIPAIVYLNEEDVSPYLGIRHISGNLRWEAFAKAVYLAKLIEKESSSKNISLNESIQSVRKIIPDRTDSIKKQYTAYKILKELRSNHNFNVKQIRNRFSLVTEITNKPDLRQYLNIENYNKIDLSNDVINDDNSDKFVQVFTWVFGNGNDIEPLFKDSRLIGKRLGPILSDEKATEHLIKHGNIEEAYERSGGEEKFFNKQLYEAQRKIENSLAIAYKFKGREDSIKQANDLLEAVNALNENLK